MATTKGALRWVARMAPSPANRRKRPIDRSVRNQRDPAGRRTSKPDVTLRQTSETAILRTAMDTISECFQHCIQEGHTDPEHLRSMMDAWDALSTSANLIARGSPHADAFQEVCAEVVKECEESCEGMPGDETMQACADVCREAYEHLSANQVAAR